MEHFPLDLNDEEKKTYEMLLAFGQLSAGELSQYGKFDFEQANALLKSLSDKGLSAQIKTFEKRVLPKLPFLKTHEHFKELTAKVNATEKQSKDFFTERKADLDNYQSTKNDETKQAVQERIDLFNKHSTNLKDKIDETVAEFDSEIEGIKEKFISDINEKHDTIVVSEKEKVTNKKETYHGKTNLSQEKILGTVLEHKDEFNSITDEFTSTVQNHSTGFLDNVKSKLLNLLESFRTDLTTFETNHDTSGKDWTKNSLDVQMEAYAIFSTALDDIFSTISSQLELQETSFTKLSIEENTIEGDSPVITYIKKLNDDFIKFKEELMQGLETSQTKYSTDRDTTNTTIESFKTETTEKIEGISSTYLSNLDTNFNNFKGQVETSVATNKQDTTTFTDTLNNNFKGLEDERKEGLAKIKSDMETKQKEAMELQKTTLHDLDNVILLPFNTQYEEMNRLKNNFFKDVTKATELHYKAMETKFKEILLAFKTKYDDFTLITQQKSEEAMLKANKEFDSFIKAEQKILTTNINELKKPIPGMQSKTEKQIIELESKFTSELGFIDQTMLSQISSIKTNLENLQKTFITDLASDLTNIVNTTDDENTSVSKLDVTKKIKENITKKQNQAEKEFKAISDSLQSKFYEPFKKDLTELTSRKEKLLEYLKTSSSEHFTSINTHLDGIEKDLTVKSEDLNKKISKTIESSYTKLKGDYKKFIKEQFKITEEHFKEEKKAIPTHKKETIKQIKEVNKIYTPELKRLNKVVTEFSTSSHELLNSLDTVIITGIPDNLNSNISRTITELETNSLSSQMSLKKHQDAWLTSIASMESALHGFNETNKSQYTTEIENIKTESLEVLDKDTTQSRTFNETTHEYATNHVQKDHDNFQSLLKNSLIDVQASLIQIVQEQQKLNKDIENQKIESFTTQDKQINDRYSQISDKLASIVTAFRESSQGHVNERETEVNQVHQEFTTTIVDDVTKFNESFKTETAGKITKHEEDYKSHYSDLKSMATEFLDEIETDAISFSEGVRDDANSRMKDNIALLKEKTNFTRSVHDHFASSVEEANATAGQLRDGLIEVTNSQYDKLTTGNEGFSKELQTTVTGGLGILEPKITILEDFERIVNDYDFPKITSLPVIGKGAALDTIANYLKNFKASVTLLIPDPKDIPVDLIFATKTPKRVTVASMFNLEDPNEKELIKKLIEQDNVTVRGLTEGQYRAGGGESDYPLYISADKDSEETFFGAYDPENKAEFAGMVSENRSYIEFIGRAITSDFLSRAKKIDKI